MLDYKNVLLIDNFCYSRKQLISFTISLNVDREK